MLGCSGPSKRVILLYLCPKFLTFSPRQVCWQSTWWGGFSWQWLVSWRDLILNCLLISGTPGVKCLKMSSEQDGQHGSSVLDNRLILLISLPLLSLFSEVDTRSLLNSMNVSDKVSEPYIKVSIENLGVGAWSLWVHSLLWYHVWKGAYILLKEKSVPEPETYFQWGIDNWKFIFIFFKQDLSTYSIGSEQGWSEMALTTQIAKPSSCQVPILL